MVVSLTALHFADDFPKYAEVAHHAYSKWSSETEDEDRYAVDVAGFVGPTLVTKFLFLIVPEIEI